MITKLKKKIFHLKNIFQTASTILGKNINMKFEMVHQMGKYNSKQQVTISYNKEENICGYFDMSTRYVRFMTFDISPKKYHKPFQFKVVKQDRFNY